MSPHLSLADSGHYHFGSSLKFSRKKIFSLAPMSDNPSWREHLKTQFQLHISDDSSPLQYVFEQRAAGPCLLIKISHKVLLKWRDLKSTVANISYLELFQMSSAHLPFAIKPETQRIEECIRTLVSKAYAQGKGLRGLTRANFLKKERVLQVHQQELTNVSNLKALLEKYEENKQLKTQVEELDSRCEKLLQELLLEQCQVHDLEAESEKTLQENKELTEYLDFLEDVLVCTNCSGNLKNTSRPINQVGEQQVRRKIKEVKTRAEKALWFLESFGLSLDTIKVKDKDGKLTELGYESNDSGSKASFHNLLEKDKDTVRALLYIMDKCCVGDAAYHEVSMVVNDIPRSYLIKQCRNDLNNIFHIARTPGKHAGAQMSFKEELRAQITRKVIFVFCFVLVFFGGGRGRVVGRG